MSIRSLTPTHSITTHQRSKSTTTDQLGAAQPPVTNTPKSKSDITSSPAPTPNSARSNATALPPPPPPPPPTSVSPPSIDVCSLIPSVLTRNAELVRRLHHSIRECMTLYQQAGVPMFMDSEISTPVDSMRGDGDGDGDEHTSDKYEEEEEPEQDEEEASIEAEGETDSKPTPTTQKRPSPRMSSGAFVSELNAIRTIYPTIGTLPAPHTTISPLNGLSPESSKHRTLIRTRTEPVPPLSLPIPSASPTWLQAAAFIDGDVTERRMYQLKKQQQLQQQLIGSTHVVIEGEKDGTIVPTPVTLDTVHLLDLNRRLMIITEALVRSLSRTENTAQTLATQYTSLQQYMQQQQQDHIQAQRTAQQQITSQRAAMDQLMAMMRRLKQQQTTSTSTPTKSQATPTKQIHDNNNTPPRTVRLPATMATGIRIVPHSAPTKRVTKSNNGNGTTKPTQPQATATSPPRATSTTSTPIKTTGTTSGTATATPTATPAPIATPVRRATVAAGPNTTVASAAASPPRSKSISTSTSTSSTTTRSEESPDECMSISDFLAPSPTGEGNKSQAQRQVQVQVQGQVEGQTQGQGQGQGQGRRQGSTPVKQPTPIAKRTSTSTPILSDSTNSSITNSPSSASASASTSTTSSSVHSTPTLTPSWSFSSLLNALSSAPSTVGSSPATMSWTNSRESSTSATPAASISELDFAEMDVPLPPPVPANTYLSKKRHSVSSIASTTSCDTDGTDDVSMYGDSACLPPVGFSRHIVNHDRFAHLSDDEEDVNEILESTRDHSHDMTDTTPVAVIQRWWNGAGAGATSAAAVAGVETEGTGSAPNSGRGEDGFIGGITKALTRVVSASSSGSSTPAVGHAEIR